MKKILLDGLNIIPQNWQLTMVRGKIPFLAEWQNRPVARAEIVSNIQSGQATGYGILTGQLSAGIMAIDCDGVWPHARLREILGGEIPTTISFTSGKPDRALGIIGAAKDAPPLGASWVWEDILFALGKG
jgi:hypothetical protein